MLLLYSIQLRTHGDGHWITWLWWYSLSVVHVCISLFSSKCFVGEIEFWGCSFVLSISAPSQFCVEYICPTPPQSPSGAVKEEGRQCSSSSILQDRVMKTQFGTSWAGIPFFLKKIIPSLPLCQPVDANSRLCGILVIGFNINTTAPASNSHEPIVSEQRLYVCLLSSFIVSNENFILAMWKLIQKNSTYRKLKLAK